MNVFLRLCFFYLSLFVPPLVDLFCVDIASSSSIWTAECDGWTAWCAEMPRIRKKNKRGPLDLWSPCSADRSEHSRKSGQMRCCWHDTCGGGWLLASRRRRRTHAKQP